MNRFLKIFVILVLGLTVSCSSVVEDPYVRSGAAGGAMGAVAGAGTGALVASVIANGDIAASAILGAGIGLPAGILIGVALQSHLEETELEANNNQIIDNYKYIVERQHEIDALREETELDFATIETDKRDRGQVFDGATIGLYYR